MTMEWAAMGGAGVVSLEPTPPSGKSSQVERLQRVTLGGLLASPPGHPAGRGRGAGRKPASPPRTGSRTWSPSVPDASPGASHPHRL